MEDLLKNAAHCGLDEKGAESAVGGYLSVLKKSKNLEKEKFKKILGGLGAEEPLKKFERGEFKKNLPNPVMMLIPKPNFAPPGPPPPMVIKAASKGIRKGLRKNKDAGNTKDTIEALKKSGAEEEALVKFLSVFIVYVQDKFEIDVGEILRLPEDDNKDDSDGGEKKK